MPSGPVAGQRRVASQPIGQAKWPGQETQDNADKIKSQRSAETAEKERNAPIRTAEGGRGYRSRVYISMLASKCWQKATGHWRAGGLGQDQFALGIAQPSDGGSGIGDRGIGAREQLLGDLVTGSVEPRAESLYRLLLSEYYTRAPPTRLHMIMCQGGLGALSGGHFRKSIEEVMKSYECAPQSPVITLFIALAKSEPNSEPSFRCVRCPSP